MAKEWPRVYLSSEPKASLTTRDIKGESKILRKLTLKAATEGARRESAGKLFEITESLIGIEVRPILRESRGKTRLSLVTVLVQRVDD